MMTEWLGDWDFSQKYLIRVSNCSSGNESFTLLRREQCLYTFGYYLVDVDGDNSLLKESGGIGHTNSECNNPFKPNLPKRL